MDTINPRTPEQQNEMAQMARASAINLLCVQAERLQEHFIKRREVQHGLFRRVLESLFRIRAHFKLTPDDRQSLEAKLSKCGAGETFTVNVEDNRVYLEGYFDLSKLKQEFLW